MSIFGRNPIKTLQRNMRFSAMRAVDIFKEEGQRTQRAEEYIQYTRDFASKILELDPQNEEAKQYIHFPDSMVDHLVE